MCPKTARKGKRRASSQKVWGKHVKKYGLGCGGAFNVENCLAFLKTEHNLIWGARDLKNGRRGDGAVSDRRRGRRTAALGCFAGQERPGEGEIFSPAPGLVRAEGVRRRAGQAQGHAGR